MKVVILAAGHGTRMQGYEAAAGKPKVMLPMKDGRPIIAHTVDRLLRYGFEPVIAVASSTYGSQITDYFADNTKVRFSHADAPSGTAGEVHNARHLLDGKTFLVYYGDVVANVDLAAMLRLHEEKENTLTMCGARFFDIGEGMLEQAGETLIINEKPLIDFAVLGKYPNCPIFYAEREVLDYISRLRNVHQAELDFSQHVIQEMTKDEKRMSFFVHDGFYYNVGNAKVHRIVESSGLDF